ncbi:hypothetical protein Bbelb_221270 [Branchiostoma belcheri]|nr:hypothetical protein Bbelb_221270 [Branchiostoma belcheri]
MSVPTGARQADVRRRRADQAAAPPSGDSQPPVTHVTQPGAPGTDFTEPKPAESAERKGRSENFVPLPKSEIRLCAGITVSVMVYVLYCVYRFSEDHKDELNTQDLSPGWTVLGREKDTRNRGWREFVRRMQTSFPLFYLGHVVLGAATARLLPKTKFPLYGVYGAGSLAVYLGWRPAGVVLLQAVVSFALSRLRRPVLIWGFAIIVTTAVFIEPGSTWHHNLVDSKAKSSIFMVTLTMSCLRDVSFGLEFCWVTEPNPAGYSLLDLLTYNFYWPLLTSGPIINYSDFRQQDPWPSSTAAASDSRGPIINYSNFRQQDPSSTTAALDSRTHHQLHQLQTAGPIINYSNFRMQFMRNVTSNLDPQNPFVTFLQRTITDPGRARTGVCTVNLQDPSLTTAASDSRTHHQLQQLQTAGPIINYGNFRQQDPSLTTPTSDSRDHHQLQQLLTAGPIINYTNFRQQDPSSTTPTSDSRTHHQLHQLQAAGSIINYSNFKQQRLSQDDSQPGLQNLPRVLLGLARLLFWFLCAEISRHYLYIHAICARMDVLQQASVFTLYGLIYAHIQFFHVKYVVLFGLGSTLARLDGISPPPQPKCVATVYQFTDMWRSFDPGLYKWLVRYIYWPLGGSRSGLLRQIVASVATFVFVYFWHGASHNLFIWAALQFFGVLLETLTRRFMRLPAIRAWELKHLSARSSRRLRTLLNTWPLEALAISNLVFLTSPQVGAHCVYTLGRPLAALQTAAILFCIGQWTVEIGKKETNAADLSNQETGASQLSNQKTGATHLSNQETGATQLYKQNTGAAKLHNQETGASQLSNQKTGATHLSNQETGATQLYKQNTGAAKLHNQKTGATHLSNQE